MDDKNQKSYLTVDHSNKQSDAFGFDPYQFWLSQVKRSSEEEQEPKQSQPGCESAEES